MIAIDGNWRGQSKRTAEHHTPGVAEGDGQVTHAMLALLPAVQRDIPRP
jgi:hypothetical protein